jgi:hypothetical protein
MASSSAGVKAHVHEETALQPIKIPAVKGISPGRPALLVVEKVLRRLPYPSVEMRVG